MAETVREDPAASDEPGPRRTRGRLRARLPRWWPLPLCAVLGALGGASYGLLQPPEYAATSYVMVVPAAGSDPSGALGFAQAYGRIATGGAVLADAHHVSGVPLADLRGGVRAMTSPDAPMIEITGTAPVPDTSAEIANVVARSLTRAGNESTSRTGARLMEFARASAPVEPASPSAPVATGVGACAGGLLGGLLLLVRPRERSGTRGPSAAVPAPAPEQGAAPPPGRKATERTVPAAPAEKAAR